jgi:hypothetical protein
MAGGEGEREERDEAAHIYVEPGGNQKMEGVWQE